MTTAKQYPTEYVAPILTVDLVLFSIIDDQLVTLLLKRPYDPFKGEWALPGGYVPAGETTFEALTRIAEDKTGIQLSTLGHVEQLYTFDMVGRDPRGHVVSVMHMGCILNLDKALLSEDMTFFPVDKLPKVAFDHDSIISYAHERLASKLGHTTVAGSFLAPEFTLTELQKVHEIILGHTIDKRNFRKKILGMDILKETDKFRKGGVQRPARLYTFKSE